MQEILKMSYEKRSWAASNPAARALFKLMAEKKTNLGLSNDDPDPVKFLELAEKIGPEIAVLKTHIDIVKDFKPSMTKKLAKLAKKHNFLIFEDRKFADIGNTVKMQYSEGIYRIADWANIVNVHVLPGPGIIKGLGTIITERKDDIPRGIVILAQMTSEGNLFTKEYTQKAVEFGNTNKELVAGYIADGANPSNIVQSCFEGHAIMTPAIQFNSKGDSLGQRHTEPREAVLAGSDCIMVGRGIYQAEDPVAAAKLYRQAGWDAYLERIKV